MRLVILGEDPGITRGGIARYVLPLASVLAGQGHEVHYLFAGGYTHHYDWTFRRRWRRYARDNFTIHELVNPASIGVPTLDPGEDIRSPDIAYIRRCVAQLAPDLIHIHSLVGIPFGALPQLASLAPIVLSIHDYFLLCQRRILVQRDQTRCRTFASQADCAWCVTQTDPRRYKASSRIRAMPGGVGGIAMQAIRKAIRHGRNAEDTPSTPRDGSKACEAAGEPFRQRLRESVRLVNENVSKVLAVSSGVRDIVLSVGVNSDLVDVMHIGSASAGRLRRLPLPSASGAPVTFMFLGGLGPAKGSQLFIKALKLMPSQPSVVIAGGGDPRYVRRVRAEAPEYVRFHPAFTPDELPVLLGQADVVVAPAVAPDTGPQIVLEALASGRPVVGSNVGGIPDFVQDGVNGRIFPCEDVAALAEILTELMEPVQVSKLAQNAQLKTTVHQHMLELICVYEKEIRRHNAVDGEKGATVHQ